MVFKNFSGLDIRLNGDGFVVKQSLSTGAAVSENDPIVITLEEPEQINQSETESEEEPEIIGG